MKKKFLTLFLAILCTFTSTNFIFAVVQHTSYQPYNITSYTFDPWALQPQGAPWCFDTCMKIVLKDYKQKNLATFTEPLTQHQININTIINDHLPEEEIVHRVFLDNNAIGETRTISNTLEEIRNDFLVQTLHFSDYYLGNRDVHEKIARADVYKRVNVLNSLLGVASEDELNDLWANLSANTKKMIVQNSPQAVLNRIQQDTNLVAATHNVSITDIPAYYASLNAIVNEIETNNRMVILVFQNINNPQEAHACTAYATVREDQKLSIAVYNPWGRIFGISNNDSSQFFDISNANGPRSWYLIGYVTFNY